MKLELFRSWTVRHMRLGVLGVLCVVFTALVIGLHLYLVPWQKAELYLGDLRTRLGRQTDLNTNLVFVAIDQPAYADVPLEKDAAAQQSETLRLLRGSFPWPRSVWADLVERLVGAGAKVVVIDLLFAAPALGDERLKEVLERYPGRVVVGFNFGDMTSGGESSGITFQYPSPSILTPRVPQSPALDPRVGYVNIWPDWDGVVRRTRLVWSQSGIESQVTGMEHSPGTKSGPVFESLDARALRHLGRLDAIPRDDEPRRFRYTGPAGMFQPEPLNQLFYPHLWGSNYHHGAFFKDKVVLVGPAANIFQDIHPTPMISARSGSAEMLGPEIHLNILNAALNGEFLEETTNQQDIGIIIGCGVLSLILCFRLRNPYLRLLVALAVALASLGVGLLLFDQANFLIPILPAPVVLILSAISALGYDYMVERRERARTRRTLERYVSRNVVRELLDNPQTFLNVLGGVRRPVTVLFSDIRNFTTMTEGSDETQLVLQLNEYFTEMVRHVFDHNGTLDKFIGDAVMAVWGNIVSHGVEEDARDAVRTALAMKKSLSELNEGWKKRGWPALAFGIGINHGPAIVGNLGSIEKMELSVIGDSINLGSRLEGLTKEYHLDLLLGETVAPLVRDKFLLRSVALVQVKGKTRPVEVWTVLGERGKAEGAPPSWLAPYEAGLAHFRARRFAEALAGFQQSDALHPGDYITGLYLKHCREFLETPPPPDWDGVVVMKSK